MGIFAEIVAAVHLGKPNASFYARCFAPLFHIPRTVLLLLDNVVASYCLLVHVSSTLCSCIRCLLVHALVLPCHALCFDDGSIIKRMDQYFPLLRAVANEVAGFDDLTTRAKTVSAYAGIKYCKVPQGASSMQSGLACRFVCNVSRRTVPVLPRSVIILTTPPKRSVHTALQKPCRDRSFTFVGGVVNG